MSTSIYPNATDDAVDKLENLICTAPRPQGTDPTLRNEFKLISNAYACATYEAVIRSPRLRAYLDSADPQIVQDMETILNSCR